MTIRVIGSDLAPGTMVTKSRNGFGAASAAALLPSSDVGSEASVMVRLLTSKLHIGANQALVSARVSARQVHEYSTPVRRMVELHHHA